MEIFNAPSLANCSLLQLGEEVRQLAEGGADWFHLDIMDGHYVPNLCFPVRLIGELKRSYPRIAIDVHLMVTNPADYMEELAGQGADYISFHINSTAFSRRVLAQIRALGKKAGVVLNPSQPVSMLEPLVDFADYVVLMTVEPGYAGQRFLPDSIGRLRELAELERRLSVIRRTGRPVGLCTHMPEVVEYAELHHWDVDFYMCCVYNISKPERRQRSQQEGTEDALFVDADIPLMYQMIRQVDKPCLAFKILGATRRCASQDAVRDAFDEAYRSIKPGDAVVVGMYPKYMDQVALNAQYAAEAMRKAGGI